MNPKISLLLTSLLVVSTAACTQGDKDGETAAVADVATAGAGDPAMTGPAADMGVPAADMPSDADAAGEGETLALVNAVNEHEIAAAEQARSKQVTGEVRAYADMLHAEHTKNMADTLSVASSAGTALSETPAVAAQKAKGQSELQRLGALEGDAYTTAYIDAMVMGHSDALAMIDSRMATSADAAVKQHLTMTRGHIAQHLAAAKELQANLK